MPDDSDEDSSQKVGYRNPPKTHQFKKGQSGNVLGRPPKSRPKTSVTTTLGRAYLAEAHRELRITEAGRISQLKTMEIAVRRQSMAAVGGDLRAQKEFATGVRLAERDERSRNDQLFDAALEYIALCELLRVDHEQHGLQPPEFEINPEDILLDATARSVSLSTPAKSQINAASQALGQLQQQLIQEVSSLEKLFAGNPCNAAIHRDLEFARQMLQRLT